MWEAIPPRIEAISPIGAGDAMAAALLWSIENGDQFPDALSWGVAAGTASAKLPGIQFATLEQARAVRADIDLRKIEA
jgi:fructose-1-phosphate kinase PfkB-like protein